MKNRIIDNSQTVLTKMVATLEKEARRCPDQREQILEIRNQIQGSIDSFADYRQRNRLPIDLLLEVAEQHEDELNRMFTNIQFHEEYILLNKDLENLPPTDYISGYEDYIKVLFKADDLGFKKYRSFYIRDNRLQIWITVPKGFTHESIMDDLRLFNQNIHGFINRIIQTQEDHRWLKANYPHFINLNNWWNNGAHQNRRLSAVINNIEKLKGGREAEYRLTHQNVNEFGSVILKKKGQCSILMMMDNDERTFIKRQLNREFIQQLTEELETGCAE